MTRTSTWYEICPVVEGQIRDVEVRGNREGAARVVETLRTRWPNVESIFVRQHITKGDKKTFRVLHSLTWKAVDSTRPGGLGDGVTQ